MAAAFSGSILGQIWEGTWDRMWQWMRRLSCPVAPILCGSRCMAVPVPDLYLSRQDGRYYWNRLQHSKIITQ